MAMFYSQNDEAAEAWCGVCCETPHDIFLPISDKNSHSHSPQEDSFQYNNTNVECPVCFTTALPGNAIILSGCGHAFCLPCFKGCIDAQVEGGKAAHIVCPMPADECGKYVQQSELRGVLGKEGYEKLARHALHSMVSSDPTLHHCPTPDCPFVARWTEGEPTLLSCPKCKKSSCLQCKTGPFHEGMSCAQYERKMQKATKRRLLLRLTFGRQKISEKEKEEQKTSKYLKKLKIRSCKKCGAQIVKEEGCNKMKCRCGYRFCYVCGSENAQCGHTPAKHGYVDNVTGDNDFSFLTGSQPPHLFV